MLASTAQSWGKSVQRARGPTARSSMMRTTTTTRKVDMGIHHTHKAAAGDRAMKKAAKEAARREKVKIRQAAKEKEAREKAMMG
jgi:hypothetical protein